MTKKERLIVLLVSVVVLALATKAFVPGDAGSVLVLIIVAAGVGARFVFRKVFYDD
ncbi:MAG: hypothetical protein AAFW64_00155 [Pseudomonadota bacterium]